MKSVLVAVVFVTACGGKKAPPANPSNVEPNGSGSGSEVSKDCPATINCMPPTEGPCPTADIKERCPQTQITY